MENPDADASSYPESERRISWLTLMIGALAAVPVAHFVGWHWGAGILIGAILAWFNFRWLRKGLGALAEATKAQASQQEVEVPMGTYFRALFRYGLIALTVYVIFRFLHVPVLSMVVGLCALGAATMAVSVDEILHPVDR